MPRRRKRKAKGSKEEPKELTKAPHSFVIHRGSIGKHLEQLLRNTRQIMEPFTASKLKVRRKNSVKDFVSISNYLNVTHMIIFTQSSMAPYMRLCRVPRGPTITYKILDYSLMHDVVAGQRRPHVNTKLFQNAPLLILNGFGNESDSDMKIKLQTSMWRNMFPTIDIHTVQLSKIQRCLLLSLDSETGQIDLRHYAIKVQPVGLSKIVKKLVTSKKIPDLGQFRSVEEAMESIDTDSEYEDDRTDSNQVTLPQSVKTRRGNLVNEKSAIRLYELGPRMRLELIKVENGIMSGEVLYHSLVKKTPEEIKQQKQMIEKRNFLKLSRKRQQEENVKRKMEAKKPKLAKMANNDDDNDKESDEGEDDRASDNDNDGEISDYEISDDEMIFMDDDDNVEDQKNNIKS